MEVRLLNVKQIAEMLEISNSFAYLLLKRGDIPTVRIGTSVNSRPMYTSHSRIDGYHQNECGGG